MTDAPLRFNNPFFKDQWQIIKPYWISEEKWTAMALLTLCIICILGDILGTIGFNNFHRDFYNALQHFDKQAIVTSLIHFFMFCILYTLSLAGTDYFCRSLSIRWRRWLTSHYLDAWLENHKHHQMQILQMNIDNPDQRISEDLDNLPTVTLNLFRKYFHSALMLFAFSIILWNLSETMSFYMGSVQIIIPGYFCIVALVCAIIGTWINNRIGKPLASLDYEQQKFNADFRFGLVRLRESSEQIAIYNGESIENERLNNSFKNIFANFMSINRLKTGLAFFSKIYAYIYYIISFVISIPLYLTKVIQLGSVTQISSAFNSVASGLSVIVEAYADIANWRAVIFRITEFDKSLRLLDQKKHRDVQLLKHSDKTIVIENLQLTLPDGTPLLPNMNLTFDSGRRIQLNGPTGIGKSTFLRALAGVWPYGTGIIKLPKHARILFIPQRSYLPLGTLKDALLYPVKNDVSDEHLIDILQLCTLEKLTAQLNNIRNWSHELSLGEQQLIAFARVFLYQPDIIVMDEASSALDAQTETQIHLHFKRHFPLATVIGVTHHPIVQFYDETINLLDILPQNNFDHADSIHSLYKSANALPLFL